MCAWCVQILFGILRLFLNSRALRTCKVSWRNHWGALPRLLKICKNSSFSLKIPLLQNFRMVENGCGGAPHTPKNFSMPKKVQSLLNTFFGHRDGVDRILESSGPKIAYFGRKIADCRILGIQKCALWVRTTPQNFFRSKKYAEVSPKIFLGS